MVNERWWDCVPPYVVLFNPQLGKDFFVADPVFKKIELVGTSRNSLSEAAANAVAKAAETVRNMSWFEVVEQRGRIVEGKVEQYQVTVKIGFRVE